MKGPNVRHTLDVRRTWLCPVCRKRRLVSGQETQQICRCPGGGQFVWMKLEEAQRVARPVVTFAAPQTETADEAEARMGPDPNPPPPPPLPPSPSSSLPLDTVVEGAVTAAAPAESDPVTPNTVTSDNVSPEVSKGYGRRDRDRGKRRGPDPTPRERPGRTPRVGEESGNSTTTNPPAAPQDLGPPTSSAGQGEVAAPETTPSSAAQPSSEDAFGAGL
jgi:hypothetical protein